MAPFEGADENDAGSPVNGSHRPEESETANLKQSPLEARVENLEARLELAQTESHCTATEAAHLRKLLSDREAQYAQLASQLHILQKKYEYKKSQLQHVMWEYLPAHTQEFSPLRIHAVAGCSAVATESDNRVGEINMDVHIVLGKGRFGDVRLGSVQRQGGSMDDVAVKMIEKGKISSLVKLRNLANEVACLRHLTAAKAVATLKSEEATGLEHVVTMHSASISDSMIYIAQEMGGSDLFGLLSAFQDVVGADSNDVVVARPMPLELVAKIANGLMAAIAAVHRAGWVHRDVKPENVLIGTDVHQVLSASTAVEAAARMRVRLCDFGVCAPLSQTNVVLQQQQFCGSPGFFAPELVEALPSRSKMPHALDEHDVGGDPCLRTGHYDYRAADVFSAGATLLEMLLGRCQFARIWAPAYNNYAVCPPREIVHSIKRATEAVSGVLHSLANKKPTFETMDDGKQAVGAPLASVAIGRLTLTQLNLVALACVDADPLRRPPSNVVMPLGVMPSPPMTSRLASSKAGPTTRQVFSRRKNYTDVDSEYNDGDGDGLICMPSGRGLIYSAIEPALALSPPVALPSVSHTSSPNHLNHPSGSPGQAHRKLRDVSPESIVATRHVVRVCA